MLSKALFILLLTAALTSLSACIFTPKTALNQPYAEQCVMSTRQLKLDTMNIGGGYICHGNSGRDATACLAAIGIVMPASSLIISGSIVVINNSVHWLEYHGSCDDGLLTEFSVIFKSKLIQTE